MLTMDYIFTAINNIYDKLFKDFRTDPLSILPIDIIQLIYNRLDLVSRCRFPAVSRGWREAFVTTLVVGAPLVNELPWVLLDVSNSHIKPSTYHLFNISLGVQHQIHPIFNSRNFRINRCHGTLLTLISPNKYYYLYDVFMNGPIFLPLLDDPEEKVFSITLSCTPFQHTNNNHGRCLVALTTFLDDGHTRIYMCQLDTISYCKEIAYFDVDINVMTFYNGNLYGINMELGLVFSFTSSTFPLATEEGLHLFRIQYPHLASSPLHENYVSNCDYLVESEGELLVVRRLQNFSQPTKLTIFFEVYKILVDDMIQGVEDGVGLVRVEDLGERMLFVGGSCLSCSSSTLSPHQLYSDFFRSNCIYSFYNKQEEGKDIIIGVARFSLKDRSLVTIELPLPGCSHVNVPPLWIVPPSLKYDTT